MIPEFLDQQNGIGLAVFPFGLKETFERIGKPVLPEKIQAANDQHVQLQNVLVVFPDTPDLTDQIENLFFSRFGIRKKLNDCIHYILYDISIQMICRSLLSV